MAFVGPGLAPAQADGRRGDSALRSVPRLFSWQRSIAAVCRWMLSAKDNCSPAAAGSPAQKHRGLRMTDDSKSRIRVESLRGSDEKAGYIDLGPVRGWLGQARRGVAVVECARLHGRPERNLQAESHSGQRSCTAAGRWTGTNLKEKPQSLCKTRLGVTCFERIADFRLPRRGGSIRDPESGKCDFSILNRQSSIDNHSSRSATMGSTLVARRAGR
jgi:hypothetical protein